jgi:ubiquinone/menaquinone biosynthesis C-methylase UbiE
MNSEANNKIRAYQDSWNSHRGGFRSLKWRDYRTAAVRYRELIKDLNFERASVLDVGSGLGDLIPYIAAQSTTFTYTGIDFVPEFVAEAKKRYVDFKFLTGDYFAQPLRQEFDIIVCCGALNGKASKVKEYQKKAIRIMFERARRAVAFNLAGGHTIANRKESSIYYADSLDVLQYCLELSPRVVFKQHYLPRDFTITIYK